MMKATIRLTSKRQATFPVELCEQLGLEPGDEIELMPRIEAGEPVWILHKRTRPNRPWLGALGRYASNAKDHSLSAIRDSIAKGRTGGQ